MVTEYKNINPQKLLEALVWAAGQVPGADFHKILKILFYADKIHLERYGRPVVGDRYIKMIYGPVGSFAYDLLNRNESRGQKLISQVKESLDVQRGTLPFVYSKREFSHDYFSETDLECLKAALQLCQGKSFDQLCDMSHEEKAWQKADLNEGMDYELFADDDTPERDEIAENIRETATNLVL